VLAATVQHPAPRSNGASFDSDDFRGGRQSGPVALNQVATGATRPFEPECLDRGAHSVNGGLVWQQAGWDGVRIIDLGWQRRERSAHRHDEVVAHPDLVLIRALKTSTD
jgi:hypothetical protein